MENLEWFAVPFNGLETNLEVTKCGRVKRVPKKWYGNGSGCYQIKYEEIDFSKLKLHSQGYKQVAIKINGIKRNRVLLHQLIAATFLDYKFQGHKLVIDHIDSNILNNHIDNLRIITHRENNSKERTIKSNLPVGVTWHKRDKKYMSQIIINNKHIHLGYYNTQEEASKAYINKLESL